MMSIRRSGSGRILAWLLTLVVAVSMTAVLMPQETYAAAKPAAPQMVKVTSTNAKTAKVSWDKVKGAKGYTVYLQKGSKFKAVKTTKKVSAVVKKLKKNTTYTFCVKAFKKKGKKKKIYGAASDQVTAQTKGSALLNVDAVTLDQENLALYAGGSAKLTATLAPAENLVSDEITWTSSDEAVATVASDGIVTQAGSGTAIITAKAHSGAQASCTVKAAAQSEKVAKSIAKLAEVADEPFAQEMTYTLAYDEKLNDPDTFYRGGGSKAEHATADYIADQYKKAGLQEITKHKVVVDGWESGESWLKVGDLELPDLVSYQTTGTHDPDGTAYPVSIRDMSQTDPNGTEEKVLEDASWDNMTIVNVGTGTAAEYDALAEQGISVEGKIVMAAVNQFTENWIDQPYTEAFYRGAAAIISYQYNEDNMGYGMYNLVGKNVDKDCDTINVQDICAPDLIPCGSISPKEAVQIMDKMGDKAEVDGVQMKLTCKVTPDAEAYVVTGLIPGKNHDQRILIGGHYDKYHGGVNDDCTAVALSTAIGKAIVDSGYQPNNDIYIVAHPAEEWGRSGAADDWAMGSWENITEVNKAWQNGTLAFINFEMPAIKSGQKVGQIQTSYDIGAAVQDFLNADMVQGSYYAGGLEVVNDHNMGMSDCISYQENGVPCIINLPDFEQPIVDKAGDTTSESWFMDRYHTVYDNMNTYSPELMAYNIGLYGGIAEYLDSNPALELDYTARCDAFAAEMDGIEAFLPADQQGLAADFNANLNAFREEAANNLQKAKDINAAYLAEAAKGDAASAAVLDGLMADGAALNTKTLKAFRELEDGVMGIIGSDTYMTLHTTAVASMAAIDSVISDLESGKVTDDSDDCTLARIASINGMSEFAAFGFSKPVYDELQASINCTHVKDTWGYDKAAPVVDTYEATTNVLYQLYETKKPDYSASIAGYKAAYDTLQGDLVRLLTKEIKGLADAGAALK